jgi:crossover junction endodeoxyribonuclease RuvC
MIIGVDPGLTGALSLLCPERGLLECADIPTAPNGTSTGKMLRWVDAEALQAILRDWSTKYEWAKESVHACIERPIAMPKHPAQTIACQFDTFGAIRALVCGKVAPRGMTIVNPKDWKSFYGLGKEKEASRACALRLYPSAPVTRVKDHNRAEAILIGHWLMREVA